MEKRKGEGRERGIDWDGREMDGRGVESYFLQLGITDRAVEEGRRARREVGKGKHKALFYFKRWLLNIIQSVNQSRFLKWPK